MFFVKKGNDNDLKGGYKAQTQYIHNYNQTCDLLNFAINKLQINRFFGILFICNKILAYWNIAINLRRNGNHR